MGFKGVFIARTCFPDVSDMNVLESVPCYLVGFSCLGKLIDMFCLFWCCVLDFDFLGDFVLSCDSERASVYNSYINDLQGPIKTTKKGHKISFRVVRRNTKRHLLEICKRTLYTSEINSS